MTLSNCAFTTHKCSLMSHNEINLTTPINYHLTIVANLLVSVISSADFQVKNLVNEITFSLYCRDITGTMSYYNFLFMPEAHGESGN